MRKRKYSFANASFWQRDTICKKLEDMAQKGWMIEKLGRVWTYRNIPPQKLHFEIVYVPGGSEWNPGPTDGEYQLEELCARDGWKLAARWGQVQIFYTDRSNPVPIETDPVTQVENIRRTMKKSLIPSQLMTLLLGVYMVGMSIYFFCSNAVNFLSSLQIIWALMGVQLCVLSLIQLIAYFCWRHKAVQMEENGEFYEQKPLLSQAVNWAVLILNAVVLAVPLSHRLYRSSWLFGVGVLLLVLLAATLVQRLLKKKGVSRRMNLLVSISTVLVVYLVAMGALAAAIFNDSFPGIRKPVEVRDMGGWEYKIYADEIPLRIEDLVGPVESEWSTEANENISLLVSKNQYDQWSLELEKDLPDLHYTVVDVHLPALYETCKRSMLNRYEDVIRDGELLMVDHYQPEEAAPWGVQQVYRRYSDYGADNTWLLCEKGRLVELRLDFEPTSEQMQRVYEILFAK